MKIFTILICLLAMAGCNVERYECRNSPMFEVGDIVYDVDSNQNGQVKEVMPFSDGIMDQCNYIYNVKFSVVKEYITASGIHGDGTLIITSKLLKESKLTYDEVI